MRQPRISLVAVFSSLFKYSSIQIHIAHGFVVDVCVEALQIIQNIAPTLGDGSTSKILSAVSPLYISAELDMRLRICDVLDALVASDASVLSVVILLFSLSLSIHIACCQLFDFPLPFCRDAGKTSSSAECDIYFGLA